MLVSIPDDLLCTLHTSNVEDYQSLSAALVGRFFLVSLSKYRMILINTSMQTVVMLSGSISTVPFPRSIPAIAEYLSLSDTTQSNRSLSLDVGFSCLKGTTVCIHLRLRLNPIMLCLMLPFGRLSFFDFGGSRRLLVDGTGSSMTLFSAVPSFRQSSASSCGLPCSLAVRPSCRSSIIIFLLFNNLYNCSLLPVTPTLL